MEYSIIDKIIEIKDQLPKKQKQLCRYIILNYKKASIMTIAELAESAGVGTTTVLRLINELGYEKYNEFKRDLYEVSVTRSASSYQDMKYSFSYNPDDNASNPLSSLLSRTSQLIQGLITPQNIEQFDKAVQILLDADNIYLLGLRLSKSLAIYMESILGRFYMKKVNQLSNDPEFIYDKIYSIKPKDVLLVFSAWPCTRKTVEAAKLCHEMGVPLVLLTNTRLNPICNYADVIIDTNSVNSGCGILPAAFITEAIIAELGRRTSPRSTEELEKLEDFLDRQDVFIYE